MRGLFSAKSGDEFKLPMSVWKAFALGLAGTVGMFAVLTVAGAVGGSGLGGPYRATDRTAEILDLSRGQWKPAGRLLSERQQHAALRTADGKVLLVGGVSADWTYIASAELYDPATERSVPAGTWGVDRYPFHPVALPSGEILVFSEHSAQESARWTAPATWTPIAPPVEEPVEGATRLPDGSVLVVGREGSWTGDGRSGWEKAGTLHRRWSPARALVPILGGALLLPPQVRQASDEAEGYPSHLLWDSKMRRWSERPTLAKALRALGTAEIPVHEAFALSDGRILIFAERSGLAWNPATDQVQALPDLPRPELGDLSLAVLPDDRVILGGGPAGGASEIFIFDPKGLSWSAGPPLGADRSWQVFTPLAKDRVLMTGGGRIGFHSVLALLLAGLIGLIGLGVLGGAARKVARAGGRPTRWAGFAAGVLLPFAVGGAVLLFVQALSGAIRG